MSYLQNIEVLIIHCLWEGVWLIYVVCVCLRIVVSNTYCFFSVLFFFFQCTLCCQFLQIALYGLPFSILKRLFVIHYQHTCMREILLSKANSAICQLYHGENKLIFNEMMMMMMMRSALFQANTLSWIFIVLAY